MQENYKYYLHERNTYWGDFWNANPEACIQRNPHPHKARPSSFVRAPPLQRQFS